MRIARAFPSLLFAAAAAVAISGQQPAPGPSKANFERLCGTCHEPERWTSSRRTRDQWLQTVNQMVARGAEGTDDELMAVVEYLTREHGRVNVNLASAPDIALVLGLTPAESAAIVRAPPRARHVRRCRRRSSGSPASMREKLAARRDAMVFGSRVASNAGRVPVAALTAANNWPGVNGGPQREGWARPEAMLSREHGRRRAAAVFAQARQSESRDECADAAARARQPDLVPRLQGNAVPRRQLRHVSIRSTRC